MYRKIICRKLSDLPKIAGEVLKSCPKKKIAFYGQLGAGKTTLIKEICRQLGSNDDVNSPTYTLLNIYEEKHIIYHFDFYRIKNPAEIFELGYEEYFFSENFVFIEWPEKIEEWLPSDFCKIKIEIGKGEERIFII